MSDAREILYRANRLWNDHDESGWMALIADDIELTVPGFYGSGSEAARMVYSSFQDAFPDTQTPIKSTYVEGDTVIQQGIFEGTHTETFKVPGQAPLEATNKKVLIPFVHICRVRDGKVNSWALYFDRAELTAQLGVGG
jgi:ketosteroid isomerase-like protein